MKDRERPRPLPLFGVFASGAIAGVAALQLLRASEEPRWGLVPLEPSPARADEPSPGRDAASTAGAGDPDVLAALRSVDSRLARLEEQGARRPVGTADRDPVDLDPPSSASRAQAIAALPADVRALREAIAEESRAERLASLRAANPEADWVALQALLDAWSIRRDRSRAEVLLVSDAELVRRYGAPDLIDQDAAGRPHWVYGRDYDEARGAHALQVVLRLSEGSVEDLWVEGLD